MSIYKGTTLIAGSLPNAANQDLSNLSQTGQAVIDGKADTDLSNLTSTASANFDGQWVQSQLSVSTATSIASRTHDLSSYLPDDDYSYEVIFHLTGGTSSGSSGGNCTLFVGTAAQPSINSDCIYGFVFVTKTSTEARNYIILPIDSNRKVYSQITGHDFNIAGFRALAYRRIGTNT